MCDVMSEGRVLWLAGLTCISRGLVSILFYDSIFKDTCEISMKHIRRALVSANAIHADIDMPGM
jgi:hypothetical protein